MSIYGTNSATLPGSGAAVTVTWSATNKYAGVTLSGGGVTATADATVTTEGGFSDTAITGKKYWETTLTVADVSQSSLGFANSSMNLNTYLGGDTNGVGYFGSTGQVFVNFGVIGTFATYAAGAVICWAVDVPNGKFWARVNGGNWNNDASANPATNTNGVAITITGTIMPAYEVLGSVTTPNSVTANFGATAFAFTAPAGFGNL